MVTIIDLSKLQFVGDIYLKKDGKASTTYWREIHEIARGEPPLEETTGQTRRGRGEKKRPISITGLTNKGNKETCTYNDPDDFLQFLIILLERRLSGNKLRRQEDFKPEIITCNVGRFPRDNAVEYQKEREGREDGGEEKEEEKSALPAENNAEDSLTSGIGLEKELEQLNINDNSP